MPAGFLSLLAAWVALGAIHAGHSSDSLVPVLVSVMKWTPFYWEQDRYGMLVPFLALPFRAPLANLLFQTFLTAFAGLAAFVLMARFVLGPGRDAVAAGTLAAAGFAFAAPAPVLNDYLGTAQPYGVSLALGWAACILLGGGGLRVLGGAACIFLATWVSTPVAFLVIPTVILGQVMESGPGGGRRRALAGAALMGMGFLAVYALSRVSPYGREYSVLPAGEWPGAWTALAANAAGALGWRGLALPAGFLVAVAAGALGKVSWRDTGKVLPPLAGAAVYFLVIGTLFWVKGGGSPARYAIPAMAALAGVAGLALAPVLRAVAGRWAAAVGGVLLVLTIGFSSGIPSPAGVRAALDRTIGALTPAIDRERCDFVIGEYGRVWPAVFHARVALGRPVWGITHRSVPTREDWKAALMPASRLLAVGDPAEVERWRASYRLPRMAVVRKTPGAAVLSPRGGI